MSEITVVERKMVARIGEARTWYKDTIKNYTDEERTKFESHLCALMWAFIVEPMGYEEKKKFIKEILLIEQNCLQNTVNWYKYGGIPVWRRDGCQNPKIDKLSIFSELGKENDPH